jgi:methylenetetrahydrofolate reductase (NADPH)
LEFLIYIALRGDPPTGVFSDYKAGPNQHQYAYQLIDQCMGLKRGEYLLRKGFDSEESVHKGEPISLCIGAAAYPEDDENGVEYFAKKVACGASYGITQMTYAPEAYGRFVKGLESQNALVPVLPGIRIITNEKQMNFISKNFKIPIPTSYQEIIKKGDQQEISDYIANLVLEFKSNGAPGVQFFVMNEQDIVFDVIQSLKK